MRYLIILLCLCFFSSVHAQETSTAMQTADVDGKHIYYWSPLSQRKAPLVIFSHGYGGCAENIKFLAQALAEDGFWVAAINHKDNGCSSRKAMLKKPDASFASPADWSETTYADRRDDMNGLLGTMAKSDLFSKYIDFEHVGIMGHSLGGYTAMGLGGAWKSWKNDHIKAVLALSPFSTPFTTKYTVEDITTPIMYQGGTRDFGITPNIKRPEGVYNQTHSDKYLVVFDGATHFAWIDQSPTYHASIIAYGLAFFDYYLKGNASAGKLLMEKRSDVASLFYDSAIGKSDAPANEAANDNARKPHEKIRDRIRQRIRDRMTGHASE